MSNTIYEAIGYILDVHDGHSYAASMECDGNTVRNHVNAIRAQVEKLKTERNKALEHIKVLEKALKRIKERATECGKVTIPCNGKACPAIETEYHMDEAEAELKRGSNEML